jgi:hypothetical protein
MFVMLGSCRCRSTRVVEKLRNDDGVYKEKVGNLWQGCTVNGVDISSLGV